MTTPLAAANPSSASAIYFIDATLPDLETLLAGAPARTEIAFVLDNVADWQTLAAGVRPGVQVVVLDGTGDGLAQMAAYLAQKPTGSVDAIHLLGHGSSGSLNLGALTLNTGNLQQHAATLAQIGGALTEDGELLIYGCEVAASHAGRQFIGALTEMTGLKVAAASHKVGHASLDAVWHLDAVSLGMSTTAISVPMWPHALANITLTNEGFESDLASGWNAWTTDGTAGVVSGDQVVNTSFVWTVQPYQTKMLKLEPGSQASDGEDFTETAAALGLSSQSQAYLKATFDTDSNPATINKTSFSYVYREVTLQAGDVISMAWNYIATDYAPFNDASFASFVRSGGGSVTGQVNGINAEVGLLGATVAGTSNWTTGDYGSTGWQTVTFTALEAGTYRIGFAAFNLSDTVGSPHLYVDEAVGQTLKDGQPFAPVGTDPNAPPPPAPVLAYDVTTVSEAGANNGSITAKFTVTLTGTTFGGTNDQSLAGVTVNNVPEGLTAVVTQKTTTAVEISFTGNASSHANTNDVTNLEVVFGDAAFAGGVTASSVSNATKSDLVIDFSGTANAAPAITNLSGESVAWAGVGAAVALDAGTALTISDTELDATTWNGASLAVQRFVGSTATPLASDVFSFNASGFTVSGADLQTGGSTTFGTFTNTAGVLTISFNASATNTLVRDVMRGVKYGNDTPTGDTNIRFTLSDGTAAETADVTVTSDTIYVTNTTDTATASVGNGVSLSEAVAIALADVTGSQTLVLGSAFATSGTTLAGPLALDESLTLNFDAVNSGTTVAGSSMTIGSGFNLTATGTTGHAATIASVLAGVGGLIKTGTGSLALSGTNIYTGTTVVNSGTLAISSDANLGAGFVQVGETGADVDATNRASLHITGTGTQDFDNVLVIGSSEGEVNIDTGLVVTLNGKLDENPDGSLRDLVKTGGGTLILASIENEAGLSGDIFVEDGDVQVADDDSLPAGEIYLAEGKEMEFTGDGETSVNNPVNLNGDASFNVASADKIVTISGEIKGGAGNDFTQKGSGTLKLTGSSTFSGATKIDSGTLLLNGSLLNTANVTVTGKLGGSGTIGTEGSNGAVTVSSGGTLAAGNSPGTITLNNGLSLNAGAKLDVELTGATAGTSYDQVVVKGTVNLTGSTLQLKPAANLADGLTFTIISNDGTDAVVGTFAGIANNGTVTANGKSFTVKYDAGDGNDVVLTSFTPAPAPAPTPTPTPVITVTNPDGTSTVVSVVPGANTTIAAPATGSTVVAQATGDTTVTNPGTSVTLNNTGTGTVTTSGITASTTLTITGTGTQKVDISSMKPGQVLTIDNTGTGTVDLSNLPDGVTVKLLGNGPVTLSDNDGATASVENTAPALTGGVLGDGNGDGTPDALQSNVASVAFLKTETAQTNPSTAPPVFVSLIADAKDGKVDTADGNTANLSNVRQLDAPTNLPADIKMPLGLIAFSANVGLSTPSTIPGTPAVGVSETFSLYVDPTLSVNGYWKQDANKTWVNLASAAFGGQILTEGGKTRLDFQITDGGQFDADGKVDGVITDPGAAASMPLSLVGYAPALPADNFWF